LRGNAQDPLGLNELLALLGSVDKDDVRSRSVAIACALSASEGWEDAVKLLGGAFAEESPGLKERKDDLPED
jgi:hypothetical protein